MLYKDADFFYLEKLLISYLVYGFEMQVNMLRDIPSEVSLRCMAEDMCQKISAKYLCSSKYCTSIRHGV